MRVSLKNFIIPSAPRSLNSVFEPRVSAIVPTYKPGVMALSLVQDLLAHNPTLQVVVVDDSTPQEDPSMVIFDALKRLPRVTLLRTQENRLKAGALNVGLRHLLEKGPKAPAAIVTLDDDVVVEPTTVAKLTHALLQNPALGAVCSHCALTNKNKNILTRLQGLEYLGFNAIRLADQGFVKGPLVMHGMLTAFRTRALRQVGVFAEQHLIEDYEITTRLKAHGWEVRAVQEARSWTKAPERIRHWWRQRTRWSYGGVLVVMATRERAVVIQDVLGHVVFLATLGVLLWLLVFGGAGQVPTLFVQAIVGLSLLQLLLWYSWQVFLMRHYRERDWYDWALRLTIVPELFYSTLMTLVLLGSYLFFAYSAAASYIVRLGTWGERVAEKGFEIFKMVGYSGGWGTRHS